MTEKEQDFLEQLLEKTRAGAVSWEPSAGRDEFLAVFQGRFSVIVSRQYDGFGNFVGHSLVMNNSEGREMMALNARSSLEVDLLSSLFSEARRSALRVDEALDNILDELKKAG